jgi:hypothetical protein
VALISCLGLALPVQAQDGVLTKVSNLPSAVSDEAPEAMGALLDLHLSAAAQARDALRGEGLRGAAIQAGQELGSRLAENSQVSAQLQPTKLKPFFQNKKHQLIILAVAVAVGVAVMYVYGVAAG